MGQPRNLGKKQKNFKVIGILYRLKNIFPMEPLKTLYTSLIVSYLYYGLLLWGGGGAVKLIK